MDRAKYRAWDKKAKKMRRVVALTWRGDGFGTIELDNNEYYDADDIILMQFTGLKDKKRTKEFPDGQPIYEGDIIEWEDSDGTGLRKFQEVVEFEQGAYQTMACQWGISEFEVIGSIHDKPELNHG